jgi:hypothetical protein
MTDFRRLPTGEMFAPRRGKPPDVPLGYDRDSGDPFVFHPIVYTCEHREEQKENCKNCSGTVYFKYCNKNRVRVTKGQCKDCQDGIR